MRLLFCCEFYHPSRGGVQEVMRQIAERMVQRGHEVTVATTRLAERDWTVLNRVRVEEFDIRGNHATGIHGETERYVEFLKTFPADAVMIKAAQQWTFDAAWPALDAMTARKVFIPCGFSGLYEPAFENYFRQLPKVLAKFNQLIFYAERYRDIDFARGHGLERLTIVPNGASDIEFATPRDPAFRARHGIAADDFLILTVGTPINAKGHTEVAAAFALMKGGQEQPMTLVLNGQWPEPVISLPPSMEPIPPTNEVSVPTTPTIPAVNQGAHASLLDRARRFYESEGAVNFARRAALSFYWRTRGLLVGCVSVPIRASRDAAYHTAVRIHKILHSSMPAPTPEQFGKEPKIDDWICRANGQVGKRVLKTHLSRDETVQAFLNADLFVFASSIEYSPLVLFEAAAAGAPFITVPVGNAEEIVRWTGAGLICPAVRDRRGYTRVEPAVLACEMERLVGDPDLRNRLGTAGREAWRTTYNWDSIADRYEAILRGAPRSDHHQAGFAPQAAAC
jgi:glycosyltransferase involved in cell wall biosynthesis